jgi:hypothetical protein
MDQLVSALRELSDEVFQRKAWLASAGPTVSSFAEQISQTFDDTGLSDVLDSGQRPAELSEEAYLALKDLDRAVRQIDQSAAPRNLLKDPRMREVRVHARRAIELIRSS